MKDKRHTTEGGVHNRDFNIQNTNQLHLNPNPTLLSNLHAPDFDCIPFSPDADKLNTQVYHLKDHCDTNDYIKLIKNKVQFQMNESL